MMKRGNKPGTININLRAIKTFYSWAVKQGLVETNPASSIPLARERATLLLTLTRTQVQALFDTARKEQRNSVRNVAILSLLLDCALRPGELLSLRLDDLTLEQNVIRVTGKMGERLLPFGSATRKALLSWSRKRLNLAGEDALFVTNRSEALGKLGLRSIMISLKKRAGLKVRLWPYLLRHTSATSYLQNGGDLELVRRLLGHNSYAVTKRYLSLTATDLARGQRRFSPLNGVR